jgi:tRNA(fMet)-specific endonuclease VapC
MKLAIDTNAYSYNLLNDSAVVEYFTNKNTIYIPIVVIAELRYGFKNGNRLQADTQLLDDFLSAPSTAILHITEKTADIYSDIAFQLKKTGRPINTNDIWIAALCIENNRPLLTKDQDFQHIPGLRLVQTQTTSS